MGFILLCVDFFSSFLQTCPWAWTCFLKVWLAGAVLAKQRLAWSKLVWMRWSWDQLVPAVEGRQNRPLCVPWVDLCILVEYIGHEDMKRRICILYHVIWDSIILYKFTGLSISEHSCPDENFHHSIERCRMMVGRWGPEIKAGRFLHRVNRRQGLMEYHGIRCVKPQVGWCQEVIGDAL